MNHHCDQELLLGYVEEELDKAQAAQFEATLGVDPRLRNLVGQLVADRHALQGTPRASAPAYVLDGISEQLERNLLLGNWAGKDATSPHVRRRWGSVVSVACVGGFLAVSVAVVLLILDRSRQIWHPSEIVAGSMAMTSGTAEMADSFRGGPPTISGQHAMSPGENAEESEWESMFTTVPDEVAIPNEPDSVVMPGVVPLLSDHRSSVPAIPRTIQILTDDVGTTIDHLYLWAARHGHDVRALPDDTLGTWELVLPAAFLTPLVDALQAPPTRRVHLLPVSSGLRPTVVAQVLGPSNGPTDEAPWRVMVKISGQWPF